MNSLFWCNNQVLSHHHIGQSSLLTTGMTLITTLIIYPGYAFDCVTTLLLAVSVPVDVWYQYSYIGAQGAGVRAITGVSLMLVFDCLSLQFWNTNLGWVLSHAVPALVLCHALWTNQDSTALLLYAVATGCHIDLQGSFVVSCDVSVGTGMHSQYSPRSTSHCWVI